MVIARATRPALCCSLPTHDYAPALRRCQDENYNVLCPLTTKHARYGHCIGRRLRFFT
jgi:hypothetical protein